MTRTKGDPMANETKSKAAGPNVGICPFCTSADLFTYNSDIPDGRVIYIVVCNNCGASGPPRPSLASAIAAWNSRTWGGPHWVSVQDHIPDPEERVIYYGPSIGQWFGYIHKLDNGDILAMGAAGYSLNDVTHYTAAPTAPADKGA